jgi:lipoyl(octanoyl) transferase
VTVPVGPIAQECVEGYLFASPPLRILVFRRPPARGHIWVPISGKVEPDDADLEAAMRRELEEETGLADPLGIEPLDWEVTFPMNGSELWRLHGYAVRVPPGFVPRLSAEHDRSEWVTPPEAIGRLHYADNRAAVARLVERAGPSAAPD